MTASERREQIVAALSAAGWNQTAAAEALGVSRETVRLRVRAAGGLEALGAGAGVREPFPSGNSTIRVSGEARRFLKRLALEVTLLAGTPREDMSFVVALMVEHLRRSGAPDQVAAVLLEGAR
jgi:hypothetical protein